MPLLARANSTGGRASTVHAAWSDVAGQVACRCRGTNSGGERDRDAIGQGDRDGMKRVKGEEWVCEGKGKEMVRGGRNFTVK